MTDLPNWWRKLPFALLIAGLILFGCYPPLLVDKIQPTAAEIVRQATASGANGSVPAPVVAN